jgi:flagellum-specific peptidoglycan hydrolase FlgJ
MDQTHVELIKTWAAAAAEAGHPFPEAAACEAALESAYGLSYLAVHGLNLFGMKQHKVPAFDTLTLPTREVIDGQWKQVEATFVKYPDLKSCFLDRLATLKRLANDTDFLRYKIALNAKTPQDFVTSVSLKWSTDPNRGKKVLEIYSAFKQAVPDPVEEDAVHQDVAA